MGLLVLGGTGRLGSEVLAVGPAEAPGRAQLDLARATVDELRPWVVGRTVLNCSAVADVDRCEGSGFADAWLVNARAPGRIAQACEAEGSPLLHVSTDYVFGGGGARAELDEPCPVQAYGGTKAAGEAAALARGGHVVRVSWLFGRQPVPFVRYVREAAQRGEVPVLEQRSRPTFLPELARWLRDVAQRLDGAPPVLHAGGGPAATRRDWAQALLRVWGLDAAVVDQAEGRPLAVRPRETDLDTAATDRWAAARGIEPIGDWRRFAG